MLVMKSNQCNAAKWLAVLSIAALHSLAAPAAQVTSRGESAPANVRTVELVQTNWTSRFVTNVIEVRAPQNIFVNEYRTNLTQHPVTNIVRVEVWRTNFLVR